MKSIKEFYKDIKEIYDSYKTLIDKDVIITGWIRRHSKQKSIGFMEISDGTCFKRLQVIYDTSLKDFERIKQIRMGSSVVIEGKLVESSGSGQEFEIIASSIELVGDCPIDYPIQKQDSSMEYLRSVAYLRPRVKVFQAVFRVRSILSVAVHTYFQERGFLYLHAPLFTASDCEGAGEMFQVTTLDLDKIAKSGEVSYEDDFYGKPVGLSVSCQFEAETFAQAFKKVYTFGPSFRADKSHTPFHLSEFWHIEPEIAFCHLDGVMDIAEDLVKYLIRYVLEYAKEEMEYLDKYVEVGLIDKLKSIVSQSFKRVTYKDCIKLLKESGKKFEFEPIYGEDISKEHEKYITDYYGCPVFITMWPKELKSFYMKQSDDGTVYGADLEFPGIGEVFGMSEREVDYDKLVSRMKELDMKVEDYEWYVKLRKYGTCPRSGFGIGFDRLVMYVTGMKSIRDVIPYPRASKYCDF